MGAPLLHVCFCRCHADSKVLSFIPADVEDPISAATACNTCRDAHCTVLLVRALANEPHAPPRETTPWIDPADGGEGAET